MPIQESETVIRPLHNPEFSQPAVQEKITHFGESRLASECAKLDPQEEQALADEGLAAEAAQCSSLTFES